MTTNPDLDQARKWAKDPSCQGDVPSVATARVIAALPDEWIDADKVRALIGKWSKTTNQTMHRVDKTYEVAAADLKALLPAPEPRTLKDMTPEEREACQWAQAEVLENEHWHGGVGVITFIREHGVMPWACVMDSDGSQWDEVPFRYIVPLPDLPRMVWPDEHHPATDAEETPEPAQPRPEDVPEPQPGEAWLIEHEGGYYDAVYWYSPLYAHWSFVVSREGLKSIESGEAKALRRLVPDWEEQA